MNAKDMLDLLRDQVGEGTASHWSDINLLRRLNVAQRKISLQMSMAPGGWLVKRSDSITPSSSVLTLPSDCSKPIYIEEVSSGRAIPWLSGGVRARRVSRGVGSSLDIGYREGYVIGNTVEINEASYGTACYVWYQQRVPDLCAGTAKDGGELSITLPDDRVVVRVADYYNGVVFEATEGIGTGTIDTITDYTAARVATVTGTYSSTTVFGTVSVLPEECHGLMVVEAAILALTKPSSTVDDKVFGYFLSERRELKKLFEEWLETRIGGEGGVVIGDMML